MTILKLQHIGEVPPWMWMVLGSTGGVSVVSNWIEFEGPRVIRWWVDDLAIEGASLR